MKNPVDVSDMGDYRWIVHSMSIGMKWYARCLSGDVGLAESELEPRWRAYEARCCF